MKFLQKHPIKQLVTGVSLGLIVLAALPSVAQTPTYTIPQQQTNNITTAYSVPERPAAPLPYRTTIKNIQPLPANFGVAQFESMAEQLTYGQRVPGLAMTIVHNGKILTARGYGVADVNTNQAVDGNTVFRLASLSKAFASTATGILVNEGVFRWDNKVVEYLPNFQLSDPFATQQLTLVDLISHRTGLKDHTYDRDIEANADYLSLTRKLANAPLTCAPGQCYGYQNVAYSLIGDVLQASTGQTYGEILSSRIFQPLGMYTASVGLEGLQQNGNWARPHVRSRSNWVTVTPKPTYYRVSPAAGVNASIYDMAKWLIAQTGNRPDVLPAPLLATLHAPVISTPKEVRSGWRSQRLNEASYALGWRVFDYMGTPVVFHAGAVQGYRGITAILPDRNFAVAILWNSESRLPNGLLPTILDSALGFTSDVPWMDEEIVNPTIFVDNEAPTDNPAGASQQRSKASPE